MGLLQSLFGGSKSKQKSESGNLAYPFLSGALQGPTTAGLSGINTLNQELSGGFEGYKKNAGFDFALGEGLRGVTGGAAAAGMLNSGPTKKALSRYVLGLTNQFYDNYLNRVGGLGQLGLGAAGVLAGAGGYSKGEGSGKSSNGILATLFG